jgi:hypothetical protein
MYNMKEYGGSRNIAPVIFNLSIKYRVVVRFRFRPLYSRRKKLDVNLIGRWMCPIDILEVSGQRKI